MLSKRDYASLTGNKEYRVNKKQYKTLGHFVKSDTMKVHQISTVISNIMLSVKTDKVKIMDVIIFPDGNYQYSRTGLNDGE